MFTFMTAAGEGVFSPRPMTFEEAARLDPDEQAGEIVDGVWIRSSRESWRHGEILGNVAFALSVYAGDHPDWRVSASPGVKLGREPDQLRSPDVAMIRVERAPKGKGIAGWLDGAPDVAVEVIGDDDGFSGTMRKALEYLAAGARMVWLVDPEPRRVVLFTPPDHVRILGEDDTLEGGDVLPGFRCTVAEMFA